MAVGQVLSAPETGWKRYEQTDSNLTYVGTWTDYSGVKLYSTTIGSTIKFNFTGDRIRILSGRYTTWSSNIKINIDGLDYFYSQASGTESTSQVVLFEKLDLMNGEHYVTIEVLEAKEASLDCIDIVDSGVLKPFKVIENRILFSHETGKASAIGFVPSSDVYTFSPINKGVNVALSNDNLTMTTTGTWSDTWVKATVSKSSGKWYWELTISAIDDIHFGVSTTSAFTGQTITAEQLTWRSYNATINGYVSATIGVSFGVGDTIGMALDIDKRTALFCKNGVPVGTIYNVPPTGELVPFIYAYKLTGTINFGRKPFVFPAPKGYEPYHKHLISLIDLDNSEESSFKNYGLELNKLSSLDFDSDIVVKKFVITKSTPLGSGKTFANTIDLGKYETRKIY